MAEREAGSRANVRAFMFRRKFSPQVQRYITRSNTCVHSVFDEDTLSPTSL